MRSYLKEIEIVGAVMVYQEGEQCRWSLNWLYDNCDRVCILLDNFNSETEAIVLQYKEKYPDRTNVFYSEEPANEKRNKIQGQVKKRFKNRQPYIREQLIKGLRTMHDEKPIDLLIWPDSDETFINEFPKHLEEFRQRGEEFMFLGFVEVYDSMDQIITQIMAPHGRVFKYKPEMTALPYQMRTVYHPYELKRPWKVRNVVVHVCHLTEEYRARRQFFDNRNMKEETKRLLWKLPKDVREMTAEEIADYQFGHRAAPPKYAPIDLEDYLLNKKL
jgi:hypothetical protein